MTVRVLHFSPGTATDRHDSHRAALGFIHCLKSADPESFPGLVCELVWALPSIDNAARVQSLLTGADVVVVATPVHGQGSPWYLRKFFELTRGLQLWGTLATAFATAGGQHTGGEMALLDTFRSLQGCGACTFTFAQKLTVIGMQQRAMPDGEFHPIDAWFLRLGPAWFSGPHDRIGRAASAGPAIWASTRPIISIFLMQRVWRKRWAMCADG
jgi:hypothetical protein